MSKQTKIVEEKEKKYHTIRSFFTSILDNEEVRLFRFNWYGQQTAANRRTKKPCRISISLPDDLGDMYNLKTLDNWVFFGVAIPKETIEGLEK